MSREGKWWCWHREESEVERFYAEPKGDLFKSVDGNAKALERIFFGVTTLRLKCHRCWRIREVEILGKREGDGCAMPPVWRVGGP